MDEHYPEWDETRPYVCRRCGLAFEQASFGGGSLWFHLKATD